MIVDAAIQELVRLGYDRQIDRIEIEQLADPIPMWISVRGKRTFEVDFELKGGSISVDGKWLERPRRVGIVTRIWRRICRWWRA